MAFDPKKFEAEVALKLIRTEQFPAAAQDAIEAGFDGPSTLRMAALNPGSGWEIDQALQPMLAELGCGFISCHDAALRLGRDRAEVFLRNAEDPLPSLPYFQELMEAGEYPGELIELGMLVGEFEIVDDHGQRRAREYVTEAIEILLTPELGEKKRMERQLAEVRAQTDWPYALNSPTGRLMQKTRWLEWITKMRGVLWVQLGCWLALGWAFRAWRVAILGLIGTIPAMFALTLWGQYWRLKRERERILREKGIAEELI